MKNKLGDNAMYMERLLPAAREKLFTIADDAPLTEAANFLREGTDLVIVCGSTGLVAGVITRTDVVGQMSRCQGASCTMAASLAMTRDVVACRPSELLQDVWKRMKERKLKNIPLSWTRIRDQWEYFMREIFYRFSWRNLKTRSRCCETMLWASATELAGTACRSSQEPISCLI